MEILILLIPLSVALVLLIGAVFWWSVNSASSTISKGRPTASSATMTHRFDLDQRGARRA